MASATRSQPRPQPQAAPPAAPQAQPDQPRSRPAEAQPEKKQPVFTWSHPTGLRPHRDRRVGQGGLRPTTATAWSTPSPASGRTASRKADSRTPAPSGTTDLLVLAHGLEVVFDRIKEMQHGEPF